MTSGMHTFCNLIFSIECVLCTDIYLKDMLYMKQFSDSIFLLECYFARASDIVSS